MTEAENYSTVKKKEKNVERTKPTCKASLHCADSNNATCMGIFKIHSMAERTTNSQASDTAVKPQHLKLYRCM